MSSTIFQRVCVNCGSDSTSVELNISNKQYHAHWYHTKDGFLCKSCYNIKMNKNKTNGGTCGYCSKNLVRNSSFCNRICQRRFNIFRKKRFV